MFGANPDAKIDAAAVRRLATLAADKLGETWVEDVAQYVRKKYGVKGMAELPAAAEMDVMKYLSNR